MSARIGRRSFLGLSAVAVGGTVLPSVAGCSVQDLVKPGEPGAVLRSSAALPRPYQRNLMVPPLLRPTRTDATTDYYEITQRPATVEILPGLQTPVWAYEGVVPGPTIVSRSGRRTVVRHTNRLPKPTVTHLHGGHTPHAHDGYPGDLLLPVGQHQDSMNKMDMGSGMDMPEMPGEVALGSRDYVYPLDQRAATLWYHDHRHGFTGPSVWRGLAGMHLVHDDEEGRLPLPQDEYDVPLMLMDRSFDAEGRMPYPSVDPDLETPGVVARYMNGVLGDVILVNGLPWPRMAVDRTMYRLRILNASNARRYDLVLDPPLSDGAGFVQIGTDGGLLEKPQSRTSLTLASAERIDVLVDFSGCRPGTRVTLRNRLGSGRTAHVLAFDVTDTVVEQHFTVPEQLSNLEKLDPDKAVVQRTFLFQNRGSDGWRINGAAYDPAHPLAHPKLGQLERWRFVTDLHHPIHLHLDHFQVTARNDKQPGASERGWKDTLDLLPAESAEILVRFNDYAGRFVFHCHNLEHEDMSMMADFVTS